MRKWENLPPEMQVPEVKEYYDLLSKRKFQLVLKRAFDVAVSFLLLVMLSPAFAVLAVAIKLDSKGPVFYRQTRVTRYGENFRIFKFRSMVTDADKGSLLTVGGDSRITKTGKFIRKYKLDELSQLLDVFRGTMTFVGTRPEVPKYVEKYTPEMMATLLMPAGITSEASVYYKDENELLDAAQDVEKTYLEVVLPDKMKYNLAAIRGFSFIDDIKVMILTVLAVFRK
ncbi:MAG: sugar transferase [Acutalibacteraceae bacterium]|nr:sugar transferase [Acutalibacteraceae bacterium]